MLLVKFMTSRATINSTFYCETSKCLRRAIQNKRRGMLTAGVVLIHGNARPHSGAATPQMLQQYQGGIFDYPPYSPDLAPNDFSLSWAQEIAKRETFPNKETTWKLISVCWRQNLMKRVLKSLYIGMISALFFTLIMLKSNHKCT